MEADGELSRKSVDEEVRNEAHPTPPLTVFMEREAVLSDLLPSLLVQLAVAEHTQGERRGLEAGVR